MKTMKIALNSNAHVLIVGKTGTGKSQLAQFIHRKSLYSNGPFVSVNLATLHEQTIESELFGHTRGAFTGAVEEKRGRIEEAQGGTLFLDEVGELSLCAQKKLLEFLQNKTVTKMGSGKVETVNVRVIAATHKDLEEEVSAGRFREDLFFRLRVLVFQLKPLIERRDEFDSILHSLLEELCEKSGKKIKKISETVATVFENHDWPGNIRELKNVLEYAVYSSENGSLEFEDLPDWFTKYLNNNSLNKNRFLCYRLAKSDFERSFFLSALQRHHGCVRAAAEELGIGKATLFRRVKNLGLKNHPRI